MKRIISLSVCIMLLLSMSVPAFAESYLSEFENQGSTTIEYNVDSTYLINIPESIDANQEYTFTATYINILQSQQVNVYLTEPTIEMTNESGDTLNLTFNGMGANYCIASFTKGNNTSSITIFGTLAIDEPIPQAGHYTGIAEFNVSIGNID